MKNKTYFNELILNCPFNDQIIECVFNPYRKMSLIGLIETGQTMNSQELDALLVQHNDCYKKRNQRKIAG